MRNFLKKYGEDMMAIDNAWAQRGDDLEDAALLEERKAEYAEKCRKACEGLPDGAIDGGWTAAGMSAYARKLEDALDSIIRYGADTLSGRSDGPDDREWQRGAVLEMTRRAKAAMRHNVEFRRR